MKYEDPLIDESHTGNVNVSREAPLKTFSKLLLALVALLIAGYFVLNILIYQIVQNISFETEKKWLSPLSETVLSELDGDKYQQQTQALQRIADKLRAKALAADSEHPLKDIEITMHYSNDGMVNAFTLPGGHVVVMRGLLEVMPNENMLAMVIGHEIGHVVNRDSLKRLGRVTLTNIILFSLLGSDNSMLMSQGTNLLESGYSRKDESKADELGVELLDQTYGHVFGAAELFDIFAIIQPSKSRWIELSSDHPLPVNRRHAVEQLIQQRNFQVFPKQKTSMPVTLPHLQRQ